MYLNKYGDRSKNSTAIQVSAANTDSWDCFYAHQVRRIMATVDTIMSSTGAVVITFYRRPIYGTTTSQVSIGTLTIASTAAVGKVYYKDVEGPVILEGDQVAAVVTTTATTSGKVINNYIGDESPEQAANITNMVAST